MADKNADNVPQVHSLLKFKLIDVALAVLSEQKREAADAHTYKAQYPLKLVHVSFAG